MGFGLPLCRRRQQKQACRRVLAAWAHLAQDRSACHAHAVLAVRRLQQLRLRQCLLGWARAHWRGLATRRLHHDRAAHSLLQVLRCADAPIVGQTLQGCKFTCRTTACRALLCRWRRQAEHVR